MLPEYQMILCCHGFGPQAPQVLRHAFGLARHYGAKVVVVHAMEPPNPQTQHMLDTLLSAEKMAALREEAAQEVIGKIREQVAQVCDGVDGSVQYEVRILQGRSADRILQEARNLGADLIVMGAHRHSTAGELLLGSTAHKMAQRSPVPILLVRLPG